MYDHPLDQYYVPPPQVSPCYDLHSQQPVVPPVLVLVVPINGIYIPSDGFVASAHYYYTTPVDPNVPMIPPSTTWQLPQALVAPNGPVPFVHAVAHPPPWVPPLVPSFYGDGGNASKRAGTKTRPKKKKTARADETRVSLKRSLVPSAHERYAAFAIHMEGIASGADVRNSIMVRHIPSKFTQAMLWKEFQKDGFGPDKIDFFYLPINFNNNRNRGYVFVNFVDYRDIQAFYNKRTGQASWMAGNSNICEFLTYAKIQGKRDLIEDFGQSAFFRNFSKMTIEDDKYQPYTFVSNGPSKGQPEVVQYSPTQSIGKVQKSSEVIPHSESSEVIPHSPTLSIGTVSES